MKKNIFLATLVLAMFFIPLAIAIQTPPFTVEFRGIAKINGNVVDDNSIISVWDGDLKMDETAASYGIGYYNHLEIKWDDPLTSVDEGLDFTGVHEVTFKVNDNPAGSFTVTKSQSGQTIDLDLDGRIEQPAKVESNFGILLIFIGLVMLIIIITIFVQKIHKNEGQ